MNHFYLACAAGLLLGVLSGGLSGNSAQAAEPAVDPRIELAKTIGAKPEELRATPIQGIFEFVRGPNIAYVSADGKFYIFGDLFERTSATNLTEARRGEIQLATINKAVPESEMLIFGPATAKHTLTVFTDIDCGYCRQLHSDVPQLNKQGVRVRYVFFPRTGPGTESWKKAEAVWCSPDRKAAFTRAKQGETIKAKACGATPIKRQFELARELGLNGTPGIFTDRGFFLNGYRPPAQIVEALNAQ